RRTWAAELTYAFDAWLILHFGTSGLGRDVAMLSPRCAWKAAAMLAFRVIFTLAAIGTLIMVAVHQRALRPTSVEMPVTIFTRDAGPPEGGTGRRFFTDDTVPI